MSSNHLSNNKRVTGLNFYGYKERTSFFPETDQATFYDANKEITMRGLKAGTLPWNRMTKRPVVNSIDHMTPEDSYDHMKATEIKTLRTKPRSIALADFSKQKSRDDKLLRTNDAYANVELENSREQRELQIQARKEQHKRYLDIGLV